MSAAALPTSPPDASPTWAPRVGSVSLVLPEHYYDQAQILAALQALWAGAHHNPTRLARLHEAVRVDGRHLALPLERYAELVDFGARNDAFITAGTDLAARALTDALVAADLAPRDLDALFFTTVTGLATPTIDARLVNRLGLRRDVRRTPLFGLGCVAGAAGLARMCDYLRGYPDHVAALVSVELCSLTLQRDDLSVKNLIASGLFGDGAAAVVALGARRAARWRPPGRSRDVDVRVVDQRSVFYPDTEWVMGWDIGASGFEVVLSAKLPDLVREHLRTDVDAFLGDHGLTRADITTWICHPGGPAVLTAMQDALGLDHDALALTWRSLREVGNLSSASVLFVLADTLAERPPRPGEHALLLAMGPGFCAELVLMVAAP